MTEIHRRFNTALDDTVAEWKHNDNVKGIFVYGSFVRGTMTANSDLDIGIIWEGDEAPVRLMSTHKEVVIDMVFMTVKDVEAVLNGSEKDVFKIAEVVNRLRTSRVLDDSDKMLQNWQKNVQSFAWSDEVINSAMKLALDELANARGFLKEEDYPSAIYEVRSGLLHLGRVIVMTNNIFTMIKPAEVLTEIRMLDPITYKLFLRTYKLKGISETKLLVILNEMQEWFDKTEKQLEEITEDSRIINVTGLLAQAQREHHGAQGLTYAGDLELAVLEMRQATCTLGRAMVALQGQETEDVAFIPTLRIGEHEYFNQVLVEYGGYDILPSEINRIISETEFLARRI